MVTPRPFEAGMSLAAAFARHGWLSTCRFARVAVTIVVICLSVLRFVFDGQRSAKTSFTAHCFVDKRLGMTWLRSLGMILAGALALPVTARVWQGILRLVAQDGLKSFLCKCAVAAVLVLAQWFAARVTEDGLKTEFGPPRTSMKVTSTASTEPTPRTVERPDVHGHTPAPECTMPDLSAKFDGQTSAAVPVRQRGHFKSS